MSVANLQQTEAGTFQGEGMQIPNGNPGVNPVITVSSSVGSGSLSSAASYYASPNIVPATGLLQLLYYARRTLLCALKGTEVDVLNPATLQWKSPISFPSAATGSYDTMALTPDGSKLVIAGFTASNNPQAIVLDPDGKSSPAVVTYSEASSITGSIVITASNKVIFAGFPAIALDLSSLTFTPLNVNTGALLRSTPDGTHIYGADLNVSSGSVYSLDPDALTVKQESFAFMFWADLAVSPNGSQFAPVDIVPSGAGDLVGFFDSGLHYLNTNIYPEISPPDDAGAIGTTYSPAGDVLVVPLGDSIEFWDAARGTLRARLMTPEELKVIVYPEGAAAPILALDPTGQTVYAISKSGITVLTLPQPLDHIPSMQWAQVQGHNSKRTDFHGLIGLRMSVMHSKSSK